MSVRSVCVGQHPPCGQGIATVTAVTSVNWEAVARGQLQPLRLRIIERAVADPDERFSPSDLAAEFAAPLGNVSYHMRQLLDQGLLTKAGTRARRGAVEHYDRPSANLLHSG
jgi:Helix-turn-helix domain